MEEQIAEAVEKLKKLLKLGADAVADDMAEAIQSVGVPSGGPAAKAFWVGYLTGAAEAQDVTLTELLEGQQ